LYFRANAGIAARRGAEVMITKKTAAIAKSFTDHNLIVRFIVACPSPVISGLLK
jgi:hypothetical protein